MLKFMVDNRVAEIVIDRAPHGNAFTGAMAGELGDIMLKAAREADIVTLRGEGADFTIGRDRKEPKTGTPFDSFRSISKVNRAIAAFEGILITVVKGRAHGLGVGLVMRSDIAIAAHDAKFQLDEVAHGIPPMFIMEAMVDHLPPKRALEVILSGREFDAEEALQMGLLSQTVPLPGLDQTVKDFVRALSGRDRSVILACKRYLRAVGKVPADTRAAFALVEQTEFAMRR